ncbi:hypothetical protein L208DRAFT_655254 [Tricholoma matsutake]|nr:hypothetical protein L208DRAFT_655254 [Tricholoma matsutake 945]
MRSFPPKLWRKQAISRSQDHKITTSPAPTPTVTPNPVIRIPVGPSGWANLNKTNSPCTPTGSPLCTSTPAVQPSSESEIQSNTTPEPLQASTLTQVSEITTNPTSPVHRDLPESTSSRPGMCILPRSTALIRENTSDPVPSKSHSINLAAAATQRIVYDKNGIKEMKAALPCVPVKIRRKQAALIEKQELVYDGTRVARVRKVVRPVLASRSSLRIKALKEASGAR